MANNAVGEIRRSAVIMTNAPGAIMDLRSQGSPVSGVSAGLEEWDRSAPMVGNLANQRIIERRLCKKLGKSYFRLPPVLEMGAKTRTGEPDTSSLVVRRFPTWLQCPKCHLIQPARRWAAEPGQASRYCPQCTDREPGQQRVNVVPVRFATACVSGHLDEFPWNHWVGHKPECTNRDRLTLTSEAPGLAGLILRCPKCRARRSLDGAFGRSALRGLTCRGKRPWLRTDDPSCTRTGDSGEYRVVQRGASNLYYPLLDSALDIPPWTSKLETLLGDYWDDLEAVDDSQRVGYIRMTKTLMDNLQRLRLSAEDVAAEFVKMRDKLNSMDGSNLKLDEYRILASRIPEVERDFEARPGPAPGRLAFLFAGTSRVARLREVRVVKGFTRISPPYDPDSPNIAPISVGELPWLPATEIRGEGVFLQFGPSRLERWEVLPEVVDRCAAVAERWRAEWQARAGDRPLPFEASPRQLLVHTFSHALIRQLTLECGYSTASLRERLYVSEGTEGMAGVLVYTGTPDSDGTLGGLQGRAQAHLLEPSVIGAIRSMAWCSSDPLCITGSMASAESHSVASCHACVMLPETSCELHNKFLDRALLVGTDESPAIGYLRVLLQD